ncbi:tRNA glutamyl-Q(34) synthetase GluQRS [Pararobbsia alpina]|uniref:Glutamyl-Q tRNA(Asp) synthetase n=1 Tax=Pararobbsia alpina TaxID=621374 RepID=A0A6S7B5X6_9BURK|nr:tRNA glutamyl-Q(34) synthetase GluQRS [Pararobbsia alpina]CAB3786749.1 Glutamyl-Q tRNA(Asp) synthetase [Pararobbsia alpina]
MPVTHGMPERGASTEPPYCGRFAPSPSGPLHAGSLVSALASFLDARAHHGRWLVRIEDIDGPRTMAGAAEQILQSLDRFGMRSDTPPIWQMQRLAHYEHALERLIEAGRVYPCGCTRKEIADSLTNLRERHQTLAYPGTCRDGLHGKPPRAWRLRVPDGEDAVIRFEDRWLGPQQQDLASEVGDFVLKRADGQWAYQLAVVVDDADAGITDIVRGADLLDSTARQIYLQRCLSLPTPRYLHVPVVNDAYGEKLSKQTEAQAIDDAHPLEALAAASRHLGLLKASEATTLDAFYGIAIEEWAAKFEQPSEGRPPGP